MNFEIPEKTKVILEMTQEFMEREVYPLEPHFVGKKFRDMLPEIERCRDMVKKMELWGPQIPKELGGMGLGLVDHAMMTEVLGSSPLGQPGSSRG